MRSNQIALLVIGGLLGMAVMGWANEVRMSGLNAKVDKLERQTKKLRSVIRVQGGDVTIKSRRNLNLESGEFTNIDSDRRVTIETKRGGLRVDAHGWIALEAGKTLSLSAPTTEVNGRSCTTKP